MVVGEILEADLALDALAQEASLYGATKKSNENMCAMSLGRRARISPWGSHESALGRRTRRPQARDDEVNNY